MTLAFILNDYAYIGMFMSMRKNILMIEDDPSIVELADIHLKDINCDLTKAYTGNEGLALAESGNFQLIILDIMLPDIDGIEVCRRIRAKEDLTPVMMLTARSEEIDKILGLETGADDYLTKPFSIREFIARVKAILRRAEFSSEINDQEVRTLSFDGLEVDGNKRKVTTRNGVVDLTPKEFDLLYLLMSNPGKSYSREALLNQVWGYEFSGYEHTVNSHINRLRSKIEADLSDPEYILTTWGVGYRFTDEKK
jgi:DNA-binding response OmpR family regulator